MAEADVAPKNPARRQLASNWSRRCTWSASSSSRSHISTARAEVSMSAAINIRVYRRQRPCCEFAATAILHPQR